MTPRENSAHITVAGLAIFTGFALQALLSPINIDGGWGFYEWMGFGVAALSGLVWFVRDAARKRPTQ